MGQKPNGDGKNEPSLELPSLRLPGFGRRRKASQEEKPREEAAPARTITRVEADGGGPARRAEREGFSISSLPVVPGPVAAIFTGLVVGSFGTGMTYLAMAGCDWIRGASTCGRSGFLPLVAIFILMILLGAVMLKIAKVSDPASTSFLAVALLCVIALLTLTDVIFSGWMFLLVPILCAPAYALSYWVTTRFVEEPDTAESQHDLR